MIMIYIGDTKCCQQTLVISISKSLAASPACRKPYPWDHCRRQKVSLKMAAADSTLRIVQKSDVDNRSFANKAIRNIAAYQKSNVYSNAHHFFSQECPYFIISSIVVNTLSALNI